jgi:hypothetical protein
VFASRGTRAIDLGTRPGGALRQRERGESSGRRPAGRACTGTLGGALAVGGPTATPSCAADVETRPGGGAASRRTEAGSGRTGASSRGRRRGESRSARAGWRSARIGGPSATPSYVADAKHAPVWGRRVKANGGKSNGATREGVGWASRAARGDVGGALAVGGPSATPSCAARRRGRSRVPSGGARTRTPQVAVPAGSLAYLEAQEVKGGECASVLDVRVHLRSERESVLEGSGPSPERAGKRTGRFEYASGASGETYWRVRVRHRSECKRVLEGSSTSPERVRTLGRSPSTPLHRVPLASRACGAPGRACRSRARGSGTPFHARPRGACTATAGCCARRMRTRSASTPLHRVARVTRLRCARPRMSKSSARLGQAFARAHARGSHRERGLLRPSHARIAYCARRAHR